MGKNRDHRTGLINLYPGSCGYLMNTRVHGHFKKTAILRGHKRRYVEITLFTSVYFTGYVSMSDQLCPYAELSNDIGDILSILEHYQSLI